MVKLPREALLELQQEKYRRKDPSGLERAAAELGVTFPQSFVSFFADNEGPFGGENPFYELLDVAQDSPNIINQTVVCREVHSFPKKYVVLTQMVAHNIAVLDTESGEVFAVEFDFGDDELLRTGRLEPLWKSFDDFLWEYFSEPQRG